MNEGIAAAQTASGTMSWAKDMPPEADFEPATEIQLSGGQRLAGAGTQPAHQWVIRAEAGCLADTRPDSTVAVPAGATPVVTRAS